MIKKFTDKDKKDWEEFIKSKDKVFNKDSSENKKSYSNTGSKTIDLHGSTLESANKIVSEQIKHCSSAKIKRLIVITGKGLRSKNIDNPYLSNDLSILKYSVPNFIKNNTELMDKIFKIDFDSVNSPLKGNFDIILKSKKSEIK